MDGDMGVGPNNFPKLDPSQGTYYGPPQFALSNFFLMGEFFQFHIPK